MSGKMSLGFWVQVYATIWLCCLAIETIQNGFSVAILMMFMITCDIMMSIGLVFGLACLYFSSKEWVRNVKSAG